MFIKIAKVNTKQIYKPTIGNKKAAHQNSMRGKPKVTSKTKILIFLL